MAVTYQFGVASSAGSYGLVQSFSITASASIDEVKGATGNTAYTHVYENIYEATAEIVHDTTQTSPDFGDILTIAGSDYDGDYLVISVDSTEDNGAHKKLSIKLKQWADNTVPTAVP